MLKKLLFIPAVALGVLAFVLLVRGRKGPATNPTVELARNVRTIAVRPLTVQPRAIGYGGARPGRVWDAVPQVGGRIIETHALLKEGNFVAADQVLLRIDKKDYDLEVAVGAARTEALQAQLEELETRSQTLETSLEIERRSLALATAELERIRSLVKARDLPQTDQDREERTVLTQSLRVQELENALHLLGPQGKMLTAQMTQEASNVAKAELAVERSVIRAPFAGRLGAVSVEKDQVVQAGQALFRLDGIDTAEVTAQVPMMGMRNVMTIGAVEMEPTDITPERIAQMGLHATVRLVAGADAILWKARVVRIRGIDAQTRTVGIDVSVADPYGKGIPKSPPLVRGMYVEVVVSGRSQADRIVVPRYALHDGHVYLVGADNRLERRAISVGYVQAGFAIVTKGLEGGETLVISDLLPAASGTLLNPVTDEAAMEALRADAAGETPVR